MKRHRLDPFSLLFGAVFVGVGLSFLLGSTIGDAKRATWHFFAIIVCCTFVVLSIATVVRERRPAVTPAETSAALEDDEVDPTA